MRKPKTVGLRVIERGFLRGQLMFERPPVVMRADEAVAQLGAKHAQAVADGGLDMIELEFPDCPPEDRFFRIGTNPTGMVQPIGIELWRKSGRPS